MGVVALEGCVKLVNHSEGGLLSQNRRPKADTHLILSL